MLFSICQFYKSQQRVHHTFLTDEIKLHLCVYQQPSHVCPSSSPIHQHSSLGNGVVTFLKHCYCCNSNYNSNYKYGQITSTYFPKTSSYFCYFFLRNYHSGHTLGHDKKSCVTDAVKLHLLEHCT